MEQDHRNSIVGILCLPILPAQTVPTQHRGRRQPGLRLREPHKGHHARGALLVISRRLEIDLQAVTGRSLARFSRLLRRGIGFNHTNHNILAPGYESTPLTKD